jgi:predicted nuclease of restriction endonuclease-like (RecB) superfamily
VSDQSAEWIPTPKNDAGKGIDLSLKKGVETTHLQVSPEKIIAKLSFSHLIELIKIDYSLKRTFYEIECIKSTWSVRELKRQIGSLYYERSGLSAKPEKLAELVNKNSTPQVPTDIIKNIYAFEFLNLRAQDLVEESDLESALLDHTQDFIVELGNGFCFEARQKRILIGSTYYFVDLLFYHWILKCHILLELKIGAFDHGDIGQLNTYLNYFRMEISEASDNPPVGILLVAEKDHALVKYATAGMDENLFVQQYLVRSSCGSTSKRS